MHRQFQRTEYDAAGSLVAVALEGVRVSYQQTDGEAKAVRRDMYRIGAGNSFHTFEKTEYQIYSSVLGKPLTEVKSNGTKKRTFVYGMGGEVVATQNAVGTTAQHVAWEHTDPSSASYAATTHSGQMLYSGDNGQAELDPLGSNVGLQAPQTEQMIGGGGWGYGSWGDPSGSYTCMRDWVIEPCSLVRQTLNAGAGVIYNGPQQERVVYNGKEVWGYYRAFADGYSGLVPSNARYIGGGMIQPIRSGPPQIIGPNAPPRLPDTDLAKKNGASGEIIKKEGIVVLKFTGSDAFWVKQQYERIEDSLLDSWRVLVDKELNDDRCKNFLREYLGIDADDLLKTFDLTRVQQGISWKPGNGGENLRPVNDSFGAWIGVAKPVIAGNYNATIGIVIHELVHAFTGLNDSSLAEILHNKGKKSPFEFKGKDKFPDTVEGRRALEGWSSMWWGEILGQYCSL